MTETTTPPNAVAREIGRFGVWRHGPGLDPDLAAGIEDLGYGAIWVGVAPEDGLSQVERLLDATDCITIATGIQNIWRSTPAEIAEAYHRVQARHPGRFLLGLGVGHSERTGERYRRPYTAMVEYLDELDALGVPAERRVLAALGPRMLRLAADRAAGSHPYLTTPQHTADARRIMGPGPALAPSHMVVLEADPARARQIAREALGPGYLRLGNYLRNLERWGFSRAELADGGSDRVMDELALHGGAAEIAASLARHLDAGADHVAIQALPTDQDPLPTLKALAAELF